jgi:hypothetical protein
MTMSHQFQHIKRISTGPIDYDCYRSLAARSRSQARSRMIKRALLNTALLARRLIRMFAASLRHTASFAQR